MSLPSVPSIKPKIPKPFQRPSVNLDRAQREWRTVKVSSLSEGDIVQYGGIVQQITEGATGGDRTLYLGINWAPASFENDETLYCFTEATE